MEQGADLNTIFETHTPDTYRTYLTCFLKVIPLLSALSLSLAIVTRRNTIKKSLGKNLLYPLLLLILTVFGIQFFAILFFPAIEKTLSVYAIDTQNRQSLSKAIRMMTVLFSMILTGILLLLIRLKNDSFRKRFYFRYAQKFPESIWVKYESCMFMLYFEQCMKQHLSTKETLRIIRSMEHQPIPSYMADDLNRQLMLGHSFENTMIQPYLDPSLVQFIKISVYSDNPDQMIASYVERTITLIESGTKAWIRRLQLLTYGCIGGAVIFLYQLLLFPLQMMTRL